MKYGSGSGETVDECLSVLDHDVREGREVQVLPEQPLGRHGLGDQRAARAEHDVQRIRGLGLLKLLCGQQRVGHGRPAQGEYGSQLTLPQERHDTGSGMARLGSASPP